MRNGQPRVDETHVPRSHDRPGRLARRQQVHARNDTNKCSMHIVLTYISDIADTLPSPRPPVLVLSPPQVRVPRPRTTRLRAHACACCLSGRDKRRGGIVRALRARSEQSRANVTLSVHGRRPRRRQEAGTRPRCRLLAASAPFLGQDACMTLPGCESTTVATIHHATSCASASASTSTSWTPTVLSGQSPSALSPKRHTRHEAPPRSQHPSPPSPLCSPLHLVPSIPSTRPVPVVRGLVHSSPTLFPSAPLEQGGTAHRGSLPGLWWNNWTMRARHAECAPTG